MTIVNASVTPIEHPLNGKEIRISVLKSKNPCGPDISGMAGVVTETQMVVTCYGETLVGHLVTLQNGEKFGVNANRIVSD